MNVRREDEVDTGIRRVVERLGRMDILVRDVAEAALFFASFESAALTGQSLVVSHGWSMQ